MSALFMQAQADTSGRAAHTASRCEMQKSLERGV